MPARPLRPDPEFSGNVGRDWLAGLARREIEGTIKDPASLAIWREGKDRVPQ